MSERQGELKQAEAAQVAAKSEWEHPVERTRAVATGEAMLAESRAMLERLPSEIAAESARVAELEDTVQRKTKSAAVDAASESELVQAKLKLEAQQGVLASTAKPARPRRPRAAAGSRADGGPSECQASHHRASHARRRTRRSHEGTGGAGPGKGCQRRSQAAAEPHGDPRRPMASSCRVSSNRARR